MIHNDLLLIFSFSILIAAVIGVIRYRIVTPDNRPFYYILWLALFNEILSEVLTKTIHTTAVNNNIYMLLEGLMYCWLFYNWGSLIRNKSKFRLLLVFLIIVWIVDNFVLSSIRYSNSWFAIISSFVLVFLSIDQINQLIVTERSRLLTNARFLICAGVIIFFSYRAVVETFYGVKLHFSNWFEYYVFLIMGYVNLFVNLIFALAALWIPTRQKFTLPS